MKYFSIACFVCQESKRIVSDFVVVFRQKQKYDDIQQLQFLLLIVQVVCISITKILYAILFLIDN